MSIYSEIPAPECSAYEGKAAMLDVIIVAIFFFDDCILEAMHDIIAMWAHLVPQIFLFKSRRDPISAAHNIFECRGNYCSITFPSNRCKQQLKLSLFLLT